MLNRVFTYISIVKVKKNAQLCGLFLYSVLMFTTLSQQIFDKPVQAQIIETIKAAEAGTSGEIRVHIEAFSGQNSAYYRAKDLFLSLNMGKTQFHNGVLIYIAWMEQTVAIYADEQIYQVVPQGYWDDIVRRLREEFQRENYLEGILESIKAVGIKLKRHFPIEKGDRNELTDEVSFG
ncbi:MAG: TPM domain-containing protein [Bacteroidia bacterium]